MLGKARGERQAEVEVLTLDRLACLLAERGSLGDARALLAEADDRLPAVYHLISDGDRIDCARARPLLAP